MLTRQLEEQNHVMKKQEAKLTDFEKTVTEQAEVNDDDHHHHPVIVIIIIIIIIQS